MHRFKQQSLSWHGLLVTLLVSLATGGTLAINYLTLSVQRATIPNPRKKAKLIS